MTTDIFIRTYHKDLDWLKYCLRSIAKFTTGFRQVIICIPENQAKLLAPFGLSVEKVVTAPVYKDDYIGQQISKLQAFKYTNADLILFVDSDMCFTGPATPETFMQGDRPVIYKTPYEKVGDAICWKPLTEQIIGQQLAFEYMRTLPLMYWRETLENIDRQIPNIEQFARPGFSEFNVIGAFSDLQERDRYTFLNTETDGVPDYPRKQAWSYGGLTPEIKQELNQLLEVNY